MISKKLVSKVVLGLMLCSAVPLNYVYAEGVLYSTGTEINEDVSISVENPERRFFGLRAQAYLNESNFDVKLNGENISVNMVVDENSELTNTWFNGVEAGSFTNVDDKTTKYDGPNLYLGNDNTQNIIINTNVKGTSNGTIGLWAYNQYVGTDYQSNDGPQINVNGKNLIINVHAEDSNSYGIYAQNSTTATKGTPSTININTDNTTINATSGIDGLGMAIVAMSEGIININSNLEAYGDSAIVARGDAAITINESGEKTTKLYGDINFDYDEASSGTKVNADININFNGEDSIWEGNTIVGWALDNDDSDGISSYEDIKEKLAVDSCNITLSNGAQWNATKAETTGTDGKAGTYYIALNNLTLNDGVINLEKMQDQELQIENISGTNGIVNVASSDNKLAITQKNDINSLTVAANQDYSEQLVQNDMGVSLQNLIDQVVDSTDPDNVKSAATSAYLSETAVTGVTTAQVDEKGKVILNTIDERVNPSNNAISNMASIALMAWRAENNDMNKRLGELRDSKGEHGIWARMVRGEGTYKSIKNQYNTYQLGYDEKLSTNPKWTVGAALSYTEGESGFNGGSGENKHTGFSVYGSYLNDDGSFIDLIAKYARLDHDFDVIGGAGSGDYETNGYSVSAEYGKRFKQDNGMWIEPQVELTYGKIGSANYKTDNGVSVRQDGMDSLVGRIGFALGKDFKQGNAYVRASYLYDFEGETDIRFTKNGVTRGFEQDLGGGWFEVGLGTNINLSDATHLYMDIEKTYGGDVATPWQWNVGVRYSF